MRTAYQQIAAGAAYAAIVALAAAAACRHTATAPNTAPEPQLSWGPAPAVFPAGAEIAVLHGNPFGNGEYAVRLRMPDGYRIPPHVHPTDENVTVVEGTFRVGMGDTFKSDSMLALPAGGFVQAPANHAHYAEARGRTIVQVHGIGPFQLTYVGPGAAAAQGKGQ